MPVFRSQGGILDGLKSRLRRGYPGKRREASQDRVESFDIFQIHPDKLSEPLFTLSCALEPRPESNEIGPSGSVERLLSPNFELESFLFSFPVQLLRFSALAFHIGLYGVDELLHISPAEKACHGIQSWVAIAGLAPPAASPQAQTSRLHFLKL